MDQGFAVAHLHVGAVGEVDQRYPHAPDRKQKRIEAGVGFRIRGRACVENVFGGQISVMTQSPPEAGCALVKNMVVRGQEDIDAAPADFVGIFIRSAEAGVA